MNRAQLIKTIQRIMPGTDSSGSSIGQSECIVFKEGMAYSFNDQIAIRAEVDVPFEGAVEASKLLLALQTQSGDEVKVGMKDDKVIIKGGKRQAKLALNQKIELPISIIEQPRKWREVSDDFVEAIGTAARTAGRDENKYTLTCVHIAPDRIEATDNIQLLRWPTATGVRKSTLISGRTAIILQKYNVVESGLTDQWIHFRDDSGLVYSVRTHDDEYPEMDAYYAVEGSPVVFPPDIGEVASRASSFLESAKEDGIMVQLEEGRMFVAGEGATAVYEERARVDYDGPAIAFHINPGICQKLSKEATETIISADRIKVITEKYEYVAMLQKVKEG